jgi:AcrR family transcriptional regulator
MKLECATQNWFREPMASDPGARRAESGLTRKGTQTRQRIVAAAADLILQRGVAGTTLDDVRPRPG